MSLDSRNGDKLHPWFTCVEEEYSTQDGLLCFYDFPRSPKVVYFCEVLAERLDTFLEKGTSTSG
jgi:hypothetical protein